MEKEKKEKEDKDRREKREIKTGGGYDLNKLRSLRKKL